MVINGERRDSIVQPPDEEREERSLAEPESTTWPNGDRLISSEEKDGAKDQEPEGSTWPNGEQNDVKERKGDVSPDIPPLQRARSEGYVISGTYVEALYPSLRDIEAARITREAVLTSGVQFENIDYIAALRYLYLVGGKDHLCSIGLKNLVPNGWAKDQIS